MAETQYVNMPEATELRLASLLSLSEPRKPIISMEYTESGPEYPEKILNIKWSLVGSWKTLNLVEFFGKEKAFDKFCELLQIFGKRNHFETERCLQGLWNTYQGAKDLKVAGRDFDAGIENLFTLLSSSYEADVNGGYTMKIPLIILRCDILDRSIGYHGYCYYQSEGSFKNLSYPEETPNYVKQFLEAKNRLTEKTSS